MPGRKILLVEGKDDEHVLKHICGNRGIPELDSVEPIGNVLKGFWITFPYDSSEARKKETQ